MKFQLQKSFGFERLENSSIAFRSNSQACGGRGRRRDLTFNLKSDVQFNGVGRLPSYISFNKGADAMNDQDQWTSYSQWGMFPTETKYS
jgi:hypothetical protein